MNLLSVRCGVLCARLRAFNSASCAIGTVHESVTWVFVLFDTLKNIDSTGDTSHCAWYNMIWWRRKEERRKKQTQLLVNMPLKVNYYCYCSLLNSEDAQEGFDAPSIFCCVCDLIGALPMVSRIHWMPMKRQEIIINVNCVCVCLFHSHLLHRRQNRTIWLHSYHRQRTPISHETYMYRFALTKEKAVASRQKAVINNSIQTNVQSKLNFKWPDIGSHTNDRTNAILLRGNFVYFFSLDVIFVLRQFAPVLDNERSAALSYTLAPHNVLLNSFSARDYSPSESLTQTNIYIHRHTVTHTHTATDGQIDRQCTHVAHLFRQLASTNCASHSCPLVQLYFAFSHFYFVWVLAVEVNSMQIDHYSIVSEGTKWMNEGKKQQQASDTRHEHN